jgi:hypothetical protein
LEQEWKMRAKDKYSLEIEKILEYLRYLPQQAADEFFLTRVETWLRRQEKKAPARNFTLPSGGWLKPAMLTVFAVLNIVTAALVLRPTRQPDFRQQQLTNFADEYALNNSEINYFSWGE